MNTLYYGENLNILRPLVKDEPGDLVCLIISDGIYPALHLEGVIK